MDLAEYQRLAQVTDQEPLGSGPSSLVVPLLGLAGETGTLLSSYKKWLRDGDAHRMFRDDLVEDLGDILWYLANVAEKFGLSLDHVAAANLTKTAQRFGIRTSAFVTSFDEEYAPDQRLPRLFSVRFADDRTVSPSQLRVYSDGAQVGDPLTDNAYSADGYRFHDAFHFAYATVLGWSPVTRRNMRLKRKSNPVVDNVEDGGRARVVEESISALVFERARRHDFFRAVEAVDDDLLVAITTLVSELEVRVRTAHEWQTAILEGFRVWRMLVENDGGVVTYDLDQRTSQYAENPVG